jgi:hypothetical protein
MVNFLVGETSMQLDEALNRGLDKLARPQVRLFRRARSAFRVCGYVGLTLAVLLAMTLVVRRGLSPLVMASTTLAAVATFLALAMATKILTGEESLTYYHHQIGVTLVTAGLLWLLRQPVLPYLDPTILGVGAFLACGRVGCTMVGCCHGRPHRWGVCYREEHAEAGFPAHFVGVRLFPIQAVESLWVFGLVIVGGALVWSGSEPGEALAWYAVGYAVGRFCFEFLRGDGVRPYLLGFSEAQWTSLLVTCGVVGAGMVDALPFHWWHAVVAGLVLLAIIVVALSRRFRRVPTHRLLHPRHVEEVARALDPGRNPVPDDIPVSCTSLGIQLSAGRVAVEGEELCHYAISHRQGAMSAEITGALSGLILRLKHPSHSGKVVVEGNEGVFHLLVRD